mmetsp:Transcript_85689/g.136005  ORF Transcript_85689/g.136005 Transcript_85689/m.136005 type:complete len:210 (-) Transcript_85689:94-723(-)
MLVGCVRIAAEGHELSMMLLVAVGIEDAPMCHQVERIVDHIIQHENCNEGQWTIKRVETPGVIFHGVANEEGGSMVHAQEFDNGVHSQVAKIMELQHLEFWHLLIALIHPGVTDEVVAHILQDHIQQLLGWNGGSIQTQQRGDVIQQACWIDRPRKGCTHFRWQTASRVGDDENSQRRSCNGPTRIHMTDLLRLHGDQKNLVVTQRVAP